jgi:uncharacterized membrane protein YfcA
LNLTLASLAVVWLGAFLGALAAGGSGFAFALVASAIWLHAFDPPHMTGLVVLCSTLIQIVLFVPVRRQVEMARLWPFLVGALACVPLGAAVVTHAPTGPIKAALGAFLLAYGTYAFLAPRLPRLAFGGKPVDAAVGFTGGVLGGLAGYSGVLPTLWTQLRGWPKEVARAVYQPFILFAHALTLMSLGSAGIDRTTLALLIASLPALACGAWLGWRIYGRLDERRFRKALAALIALSGLFLVLP